MFFRKNNKSKTFGPIKTKYSLFNKYKFSPILNMNKRIVNLNKQKEGKKLKEQFSTENITNLPSIFNSLSPNQKAQNKFNTQKSLKHINFINHHIKPKNLFANGKINDNLNKFKYHLNLFKNRNINYRKKSESLDKNFKYNKTNFEKTSTSKFNFPNIRNINNLRNSQKNIKLFSSIKIDLKKFSQKLANATIDDNKNDIIIKSFLN